MLKAQKKLSKRELKEDKFVTFYFQAQDYFYKNSKIITGALIALIVVVFAIYGFNRMESSNNEVAQLELTKAKVALDQNNPDAAIDMLLQLVGEYGGTASGKEACFYLGNAYFEKKDYDNAEHYYQEFLGSHDDEILESSALAGIAACQEEKQDYAAAAASYEKAAREYSGVFLTPLNLYNSARCYILAEQNEKARQLLNQIIEEYETSGVKTDAEIMLAELLS
jgi:predicted negative regulator of RcsB-dependent stress response